MACNDRSADITVSRVPLVSPCIQRLQGEAERETRVEEEGEVKTVGDRRVGGLSGCGHITAMLLEETGTSAGLQWEMEACRLMEIFEYTHKVGGYLWVAAGMKQWRERCPSHDIAHLLPTCKPKVIGLHLLFTHAHTHCLHQIQSGYGLCTLPIVTVTSGGLVQAHLGADSGCETVKVTVTSPLSLCSEEY